MAVRKHVADGQQQVVQGTECLGRDGDVADRLAARSDPGKPLVRLMADTGRLTDRAARRKTFDALESEMRRLRTKFADMGGVRGAIWTGKGKLSEKVGKAIGEVLIALLLPAIRKVQDAEDRAEQTQRNLQVAFALAAYRIDMGKHPMKPATPNYLPKVPNDLFADASLVYRPMRGRLSLLQRGHQRQGRGRPTYEDDPKGDDLRVMADGGEEEIEVTAETTMPWPGGPPPE